MENSGTNLPVVAKKIWNIVRVMFFMVRKSISKKKLMVVDINLMMKRGKIISKAIHNLMFHFHHFPTSNRQSTDRHLSFPVGPDEYEFSCSNSPAFPFNHLIAKRKHHHRHHHSHFFACGHAPTTDDDVVTANAVKAALDMLNSEATSPAAVLPGLLQSPAVRDLLYSELASPALPGLRRSPKVRQLRITDSPFPLQDVDSGDSQVDQAAEDFIIKFHNDLKKQNIKMAIR